ncbi:hypothetical protein GOARA_021_00960 [Gordonia araii NBRC 100433]|uniref:DUF4307 domain-containing protein n=1 Tax=Gordonia araii NBRC 100433 TaxID=1073574 RepID=G7GZ34_9ACTN|nr:DUF4307 domain-containing protein [Gordonia araii]NNG97067.1 DUF4307 domain-containing protein [Gordonia araii NBRC 100433]GAB08859.1 hypothetical protein GOARA_021_00960 [Gordonia araii NBRC 100433]
MNASDGGASGPSAYYPGEQSSSSRRRWFLVLTGLVLAAGLGLAILGFQKFGNPDVSGEGTGFFITGPTTVDVQFTVNRSDPTLPVACVVKARAKDGSEVGRREVLVEGGTAPQVGVRATVHTSARPVIGEVFGCGPTVPPYLTSKDDDK